MAELEHRPYQKTVQDLIYLYQRKQLHLSPGFQRDSVWTTKDRSMLIDTLLRGWPLPAIFLYRRQVNGDIVYE